MGQNGTRVSYSFRSRAHRTTKEQHTRTCKNRAAFKGWGIKNVLARPRGSHPNGREGRTFEGGKGCKLTLFRRLVGTLGLILVHHKGRVFLLGDAHVVAGVVLFHDMSRARIQQNRLLVELW